MARAIVNVPATAKRGEPFEIRTLIGHPMETGFRVDEEGRRIPRDLIRRLTCRYNGETVFVAELFPATAANPYVSFYTLATESGTLAFTWEGDNGFVQTETVALRVT
jgi:sulfur-oxidizing protein SoxZ